MTLAAPLAEPSADIAGTTINSIPRRYNFAADILDRNLKAGRANKAAFADGERTMTYGELAERADRFGAALRTLGVAREQRVLMCMLDTVDWPVAFLGAIKAGIVAVPVNTLMTEDDYRFILADSRAKALIVSQALYPKFAKIIGESEDLDTSSSPAQTRRAIIASNDLVAVPGDDYTADTTRDDIAFWLYTSGSTGKPKGAVHVHANLRLTAELYGAHVLGVNENDVCFSVAKLFFAYGLGNALTFPMTVGATIVLLPDRHA